MGEIDYVWPPGSRFNLRLDPLFKFIFEYGQLNKKMVCLFEYWSVTGNTTSNVGEVLGIERAPAIIALVARQLDTGAYGIYTQVITTVSLFVPLLLLRLRLRWLPVLGLLLVPAGTSGGGGRGGGVSRGSRCGALWVLC